MDEDNPSGSRETLISTGHHYKEQKSVSFFQLFRFSSSIDRILIVLGTVAAAAAGVSKPFQAGLMGGLSNAIMNFSREIQNLNDTDPRRQEVYDNFYEIVIYYVFLYILLFLMTFVTGTIQDLCFILAGENMVNRLRKKFMRALMRQEIAWFDTQKTGILTNELFSNIEKFKNGTGDHIGYSAQTLSMFVSGFAVCFYHNWRLTLIGTCLTPVIAIWGYFDNEKMTQLATDQEDKDGEAGAAAEQALTCIRTVMMFNGQEQECERYRRKLNGVRRTGIQIGYFNGIWNGVSIFLLFACFCMTVYFGINFVFEGKIDGGTVITLFVALQLCIGHLDRIAPLVSKVNRARGAALALYKVIDRDPQIDAYSDEGLCPVVVGRVQVRNLLFSYPSRPEIPVLKSLDFTIEPGQTVALVGASGSGKSTVVQLLLRFYDPTDGRILIDGVDTDQFNISHLRQTIGVVSQEAMLFNTTIEENIRFGRQSVTENQIWAALKEANAYDFVKEFPMGLQTVVGDRGAQLSGGQKQRIAIARALVRDPKILLLDEATSALDAQSEAIVQQALEKAVKGRTTLVIAHRLSTVRNADKIIAMRQGEVIETGTHDELMTNRSHYFDLVNNQVFIDTPTESVPPKPQYRFSRSISSEGTTEYRRLRSLSLQDTIPEEEVLEDVDLKRLKEDMTEEGASESSFWKILREATPESKLLLGALLIGLLEGLVYPAFSFTFTELIKTFTAALDDSTVQNGHLLAFAFLGIGFHYGVTVFIRLTLCGIISERLAQRLRMKVYRNLLRQDAAYFDKSNHAPGRLLTRLATDANNIKPAINDRMSLVLVECITDFLAYSFSFYFAWQMALVAVPLFPLGWIVFSIKSRFLTNKMLQDEKDMEAIGKLATETLSNMRTVHALTLQDKIYEKFCNHLTRPIRTGRQKAVIQSFTYGLTVSIHFLLYGVCFRAGLYFIYHNYMDPQNMLRSLFMVSLTSGGLGAIAAWFPDYLKAKMAAGLLFKMSEQVPKIDGMTEEGQKPQIEGNIRISDIRFRYPERDDVEVLKGLDLEVKKGATVALVGASGCGKSTVTSLLERMYDPVEGKIEIDGFDVAAMNPRHLRANISMVSQEPVLFDMTIKENILYGLPESSVSHSEMIEAAKRANIHDFVASLPEAYQTRVGDKGTQLSGGQKQRIAIARALVRRPRILILDEATSALDTESEKHVQEALEEAGRGRSCLVVAHRLSTIRNASQIVVFKEGKVAERGSHEDLLNQRGVYFNLVQKQNNSSSG